MPSPVAFSHRQRGIRTLNTWYSIYTLVLHSSRATDYRVSVVDAGVWAAGQRSYIPGNRYRVGSGMRPYGNPACITTRTV